MSTNNHALQYETVRGGVAVVNPEVGSIGTIGCVGTSDGDDRWIISCYHVLCREQGQMPDGASESIFYPFDVSRRNPVAIVTNERADAELDCAAALIPDNLASSEILGIGKLLAVTDPVVGMRVIKSGAETRVTEGRIQSFSDTEITIAPFGMPAEYELSEGGDSGSLWVDASTMSPVGLHFKGSDRGTPERAFARPISSVLECLKLELLLG